MFKWIKKKGHPTVTQPFRKPPVGWRRMKHPAKPLLTKTNKMPATQKSTGQERLNQLNRAYPPKQQEEITSRPSPKIIAQMDTDKISDHLRYLQRTAHQALNLRKGITRCLFYKAPLENMKFVLYDVLNAGQLSSFRIMTKLHRICSTIFFEEGLKSVKICFSAQPTGDEEGCTFNNGQCTHPWKALSKLIRHSPKVADSSVCRTKIWRNGNVHLWGNCMSENDLFG